LKGNKKYILIFFLLLVLYVIAQVNQPKAFDWSATLQSNDKNPYGTYILHEELKQLFPNVTIQSHRLPIYNVLHNQYDENSAYILVAPSLNFGETDLNEMLNYVRNGNVVLLSAYGASKTLLDTLGVKVNNFNAVFDNDSTTINFVNPALKAAKNYSFNKSTIDGYFSALDKKDSTVVLGTRNDSMPNFVKRQYGEGFFLLHAAPLCFSNYFLLTHDNNDYTAKVLSYIPSNTTTLHWDDYNSLGRTGSDTPLRFFLSNTFLHWALMLAVVAIVLFVLFEMKRKQRIIPVIEPLRNTTLDFVETVSSVYFSQRDNKSIAQKKAQFWMEYIRQHYYIPTQKMDDAFVQQLHRKTAVPVTLIESIIHDIVRTEAQPKVTDDLLLQLSNSIDEFYQLSKK